MSSSALTQDLAKAKLEQDAGVAPHTIEGAKPSLGCISVTEMGRDSGYDKWVALSRKDSPRR